MDTIRGHYKLSGLSAYRLRRCEQVNLQNLIFCPHTWHIEYPHTSVTVGGHDDAPHHQGMRHLRPHHPRGAAFRWSGRLLGIRPGCGVPLLDEGRALTALMSTQLHKIFLGHNALPSTGTSGQAAGPQDRRSRTTSVGGYRAQLGASCAAQPHPWRSGAAEQTARGGYP